MENIFNISSLEFSDTKTLDDSQARELFNFFLSPLIKDFCHYEAVPSIDTVPKIADAFEVSMDHLVGVGINASFDKKTLNDCRILKNSILM